MTREVRIQSHEHVSTPTISFSEAARRIAVVVGVCVDKTKGSLVRQRKTK